jgi:hypothetical protein
MSPIARHSRGRAEPNRYTALGRSATGCRSQKEKPLAIRFERRTAKNAAPKVVRPTIDESREARVVSQ